MKKRNGGDVTATEQEARAAKAARRERRKEKRAEAVKAALRPLLLQIGQLQAQLRIAEAKVRDADK